MRTESSFPLDLRLPTNTIVSHYAVDVIAFLEPEFRLEGFFNISSHVTLNFVDDGYVTIHAHRLSIDESSIVLDDGFLFGRLTILEHIYDFERDFYTIKYIPPAVDASFDLFISGNYQGDIVNVFYGFHWTAYQDRTTNSTKYMALTELEPAGARWVFPCLDEPSMKALFTFRIGRHNSLISLSNMPMINTDIPVDNYPDYVWDEYLTSVPMSTYLIAMAVAEYDQVVSDPLPNGVVFSNWARPDAISDNLTDLAKDVGPRILEYFENLFDIPFVLPKLDQISYTGSSGAMENWGLVTYGERVMLIDESQASARDKINVVSVIAHELAHQWFGDLVTCAWWDSLWLNEGFAEYVEYFAEVAVAPYMEGWQRFMTDELMYVMTYDDTAGSHAMMQNVTSPAQTDFGPITYSKGSSINRMMEHMLTKDVYLAGLIAYLNTFTFSNTVPDNLFDILTFAGHSNGTLPAQYDMQTLMNPWIYQKNYPLLTVTRDYALGTVTLSQSRFLTEPDNTGDTNDYQWYLPLTYTRVEDGFTDFTNIHATQYLEPQQVRQDSVGIFDAPILFNLLNYGYYRVNYDMENWNRLIDFLLLDDFTQIAVESRAQLLGDSYAVAQAGIESFDLPYRLAQYLTRELEEYVPFAMAIDIYYEIGNLFNPPPEALLLENLLVNIFYDRYISFGGIASNANDTFGQLMYKRAIVDVSCGRDMVECVNESTQVFSQWMQSSNPDDPDNNPVNPNTRYPVYCTALRNGGSAEKTFLENRLANCYNPQEIHAMSNALECSNSKEQMEMELKQVLSSSQGNLDGLVSVMMNPKGRKMGFDFLYANEEELNWKFGAQMTNVWKLSSQI